jgi:membrane protease YdiL (CAAX protease family)
MKYPDPKRVYAQGLGFLLGFSALGALLNYLNTLDMVSPAQEAPQWVHAIFWVAIVLFYVPIYGAFVHSVRNWKWSLDEWGFGLRGRTWLSIGLAFILLLFVWLPLPSFELGSIHIGDLGSMRANFSQVGIPMLLFGGYARSAEELLYRGFALVLFQRMFSRYRSNKLWAVILSSALFALVHTHRVPQMLQLFLGTSIPLAALTIWTRSISVALVIHALAGGGHVGALCAALFFSGVAVYNARRKKLAQSFVNADPAPL